jgi:hypothetical protein
MAGTVVSPQTVSTSQWIDVQTQVGMASGNWLIAIVTWRYLETGVSVPRPVTNVADAPRNVWTLLSTSVQQAERRLQFPSNTTTGILCVQVWACPKVEFDAWPWDYVTTSLQAFLGIDQSSAVISYAEISGMTNGYLTVDSVTTWQAYTSNTLTMTVPAPTGAADCMMIAAAATDVAYASYSVSGTGWTQLTNATKATPDLGLVGAWRDATTTGTVTLTLGAGATKNWVGVAVSFRSTGVAPVQPNVNWPAVEFQLGYGYNLSQPTSTVWWTDQSSYYWAVNTKRGIQYELGTAQAEATSITLRNNDGSFSPRNSNAPPVITCTATGTTTTFKCLDASAAPLNVTDTFTINYASINSNTDFSGGTTGWTGTGGTFTASGGVGQIVPSGVAATVQVESTHIAVTPGNYYNINGLLQNNVARGCTLRVNWYDSGAALISSPGVTIPLAANTLQFYDGSFIAPSNAATGAVAAVMTGTPPASNVLFMDNLNLAPADEFTNFKVTALSSSGGTTTVTYVKTDNTLTGGSLLATKVGDVITFTPIDMYLPYRILMSWNGKREYLCAGWIERWPQTWRDPYWGTVGALGVSALATITAANPSALQGEIQRRNPWAYWPLSDAAGSNTATNIAGRSTTQLVKTDMNAGAGTANSDFGAATQGTQANASGTPTAPNLPFITTLIGDPGSSWGSEYDWAWVGAPTNAYQGNGPTELNANKGTALVATNAAMPPISGGVTIFWCGMTSIAAQAMIQSGGLIKDPTVFILRDANPADGVGQGSVIKVALTHNTASSISITTWNRNTHGTSTVNTGAQYGVQWQAYALVFDQTQWAFYAGGTMVTNSGATLVNTFTGIDVGGEADQFFSGNGYPGQIAHFTIFDRSMTEGDIFQLTVAAQLGYGSESEVTSDRVQRKLDTIGMKTGRIMDNSGQAWLDAEGQDASTVTDLNNQIAAYEDAYVFEDGAGVYQYRPPARYAFQGPIAVLGENEAGGELPYLPGPEIDFDPTYLYNFITVLNSIFNTAAYNNTLQTTTFSVQDDVSSNKYGLRTFGRDTRLSKDEQQEVFYLAYWLLSQYASSDQRFQSVTLDPASNPDLWRFCLTVEVADLVTVVRRPIGAPTITSTCVVMQVNHDGSSGRHLVTLTLAQARSSGLILNDVVQGIAGTNYFTME